MSLNEHASTDEKGLTQTGTKCCRRKVVILTALVFFICFFLFMLWEGRVHRYPPTAVYTQNRQFHSIDVALELYESEHGDYPPSGALDDTGGFYCGAMKLAEAMLGQDMNGFHPESAFRSDGKDDAGVFLYRDSTKGQRRQPYLQYENANPCRLKDVFEDVGPFDGNEFVLCDEYSLKRHSGKLAGMPVLYYKANTQSSTINSSVPMAQRIYNAEDNLELIRLAQKQSGPEHPLADPEFFYSPEYKILDKSLKGRGRTHRPDSFILISAGSDGIYGTEDDILNFEPD